MEFSAEGLPKGLKLDAGTGRITGSVAKSGKYIVTLRARNALAPLFHGVRLRIIYEHAHVPSLIERRADRVRIGVKIFDRFVSGGL